MTTPVTGLSLFAPEGQLAGLCATCNGNFYLYDANGIAQQFLGATIDPVAHCAMVQAMDELYCSDGVNPMFVFGGSTTSITVTGKVTLVSGTNIVTGNGTLFTTQLMAGQQIVIKGESHFIMSILSDTTIYTTTDWTQPTFSVPVLFSAGTIALAVPHLIAADGVTELTTITDMAWFIDRMWYAVGDLIYFSDVGNPLSITDAPVRCRQGAGDKLVRLQVYRDSYLLCWKVDSYGLGSLQALDVSSNDPTQFQDETVPWFDNQSLVSPQCIIQSGVSQSSDVVFNSREGLRSLTYTSLDKLTYPSLPLTSNIPDVVNTFNSSAMNAAFCALYEDELLFFVPTGSAITPNLCISYSLKVPRDNLQQGVVVYDMMPATCACVGALLGEELTLYLGTADGKIQQAFAQTGTHTYAEISKEITYDKPDQDKTPMKYILEQDSTASGVVTASLIFDDGTTQIIGSQSCNQGTVTFPITFPCIFPASGMVTNFSDLHFDTSGNSITRSKGFRSQLTSTDAPVILGFSLQSTLEEYRYLSLNEPDTGILPTPTAEQELEASNYEG